MAETRALRLAVGLRRWARCALMKHFAKGEAQVYADWERLHNAAEKYHEKLDPDERAEYLQWSLGEKAARR